MTLNRFITPTKVQGNFRKAHKNADLRIREKSAELGAETDKDENGRKLANVLGCRKG